MIGQKETNYIADRYFYESYKKMEERKVKSLSYYVVRALAVALTIPINHIILEQSTHQGMTLLTTFLVLTLAYTLLLTFFSSYFYCAYVHNGPKVLKIATAFHHTYLANDLKDPQSDEIEEEINLHEIQEGLGLRVSTVYYDFQNMQKINEVSQEFKAVRQSNGSNLIKSAIEADLTCFKAIDGIFMFVSICLFALGVAVSIMAPLNQTQHSLLQMVLISEVVLQPRVYAILLIICLSPLILLGVCVYFCCCGGQLKKAKLPPKTKVTPESMAICSECSICFQTFAAEEEVAVLPCSDMHVFHYSCIEGWSKVKPNCPICRHLLT